MRSLALWVKRLLLGCLGLLLLYQLWLFGWVLWWNWANPENTRFMNIRLDELRVRDPQAQLKKQWIAYEPPNPARGPGVREETGFVSPTCAPW